MSFSYSTVFWFSLYSVYILVDLLSFDFWGFKLILRQFHFLRIQFISTEFPNPISRRSNKRHFTKTKNKKINPLWEWLNIHKNVHFREKVRLLHKMIPGIDQEI